MWVENRWLMHLATVMAYLVVFCSCSVDTKEYTRLEILDSLTSKQPGAVMDSLKRLDASRFSSYNRAYYQLLTVMASDKSRVYATSDSLINLAVKGLSSQKQPYNYGRALFYQGVVRYRMNIFDSTTIMPIKRSIDILESLNPRDNDKLYGAHYYLALAHEKYSNDSLVSGYLQRCLYYAKASNDSIKILSAYLELCWSRMAIKDFKGAGHYVDTIMSIPYIGTGYENYRENTCAAYFSKTGQTERALQANRRMLCVDLKSGNRLRNLRTDYCAISYCFKDLHQLDSALYYARMAVKQIQDTTDVMNYYYYQNVAEVSGLQRQWVQCADAYKNAFISLKQSIKQQTDTQLQEAEKRYDKSQAEKKALELIHHNRLLYAALLLIVSLLMLVFMLSRQRKLKHVNRLILMEQEKLVAEQQNLQLQQDLQEKSFSEQLVQRDNDEKHLMLELFQFISHRYAETQKKLQGFSDKLILEYPQIYERLKKELDTVQKEFQAMNEKFINDDIFCRFTGIECNKCLLTDNEKTLLVLMACNATNKQIALLLGTTTASLRVRRYNLKNKLIKQQIQLSEPLNSMLNTPNSTETER